MEKKKYWPWIHFVFAIYLTIFCSRNLIWCKIRCHACWACDPSVNIRVMSEEQRSKQQLDERRSFSRSSFKNIHQFKDFRFFTFHLCIPLTLLWSFSFDVGKFWYLYKCFGWWKMFFIFLLMIFNKTTLRVLCTEKYLDKECVTSWYDAVINVQK